MPKDSKRSPPSFSGNDMPMNINPDVGLDQGTKETSRRMAFQPTFEPLSNFQPPSFAQAKTPPTLMTHNTTQQKQAPVLAVAKPPTTPNGVWCLESVPVLPEFYRLERTAAFCPHTNPSTVALRVSNVLRELSIESTYDDAKATAKCMTEDGVDFRVHLFKGRGKYNHGIIVEVQRRFGAFGNFHHDTTAILDAAQGKVPPPPPASKGRIPLVDEDDVAPPTTGSSLTMVSHMLLRSGYDTQNLGMQMLCSLTDASKMGKASALRASEELLHFDESNQVGKKVLDFVMDKKGDDECFKLHTMALTVLANAIQTVKGEIPLVLKEQLRDQVVYELRRSEKTPRTALQAARIAEYLVHLGSSDLYNALEDALAAGRARHANLERQAQVCLDKCVQ